MYPGKARYALPGGFAASFPERIHMMLKRIICLIICGALLVTGAVTSVFAASNEQTVFDFLTSDLGLNSAAACGVMANIEKESNFQPDIYGDNGTSYGICQWHDFGDGGRFTRMKEYCAGLGLDYKDLIAQLRYLGYELQNFYPKVWNVLVSAENTPEGAYEVAYYWCYNFEIPANRGENSEKRGILARDTYWKKYGNSEIAPVIPDDAEIWLVTADVGLNIRTGPGTEYPVSATYTYGTQITVTEKSKGTVFTWGKTPRGWCVLEYCEFVSGSVTRTIHYFTDCAVNLPSQAIEVDNKIASSDSLRKYGFTFAGWSDARGGEVKYHSGDTYDGGTVTLYGVWNRDTSVKLISGDANCDGSVTSKDVSVLLRHMSGWETCIVAETADANADGTVNAKDASFLMKYLAGWGSGEQPTDDYPDVTLTDAEKSFIRRTVFVGDSICCGYNAVGIVPDECLIARSGVSTANIFGFSFWMGNDHDLSLTEAAKRIAYSPEYIVVTLGMNDVPYNNTKMYTENYKKAIDALRGVFPGTPVAVCATTPVIEKSAYASNDAIREYNNALKDFAAQNGYVYIDTFTVLVGTNGALKPGYAANDDMGVHLTAKAYPVLTRRICDTIMK